MRRLTRLAAVLALAVGGLLLATPGVAGADCKTAPIPEAPGLGVTGWFVDHGPTGVPSNPQPFDKYAYAGMNWSTYDLGCGPSMVRDPSAVIGTAVANWMFDIAKFTAAATNAFTNWAFHPTFMQSLTPMVTRLTRHLHDTVYTFWAAVALGILGLILMWRSRHGNMQHAVTRVGGAVLVMVVATVVFNWPATVGGWAQKVQASGISLTTQALTGRNGGDAASAAASNTYNTVLHGPWEAGMLGRSNGPLTAKYGPKLLDGQALTWTQAAQLQRIENHCVGLIIACELHEGLKFYGPKQREFKGAAANVAKTAPSSYQYLTGHDSDARVQGAGEAIAAAAVTCPFQIIADALVIFSQLIVLLAIILIPVLAVPGILFSTVFTTMLKVVGSALAVGVLMVVMAAVNTQAAGYILSPASHLPAPEAVLIMGLFAICAFALTKPFRRLGTIIDPNGNHFGAAAAGGHTGASSAGWGAVKWGAKAVVGGKVLSAAARSGGRAAADEYDDRQQEHPQGPPAEAQAADHHPARAPASGDDRYAPPYRAPSPEAVQAAEPTALLAAAAEPRPATEAVDEDGTPFYVIYDADEDPDRDPVSGSRTDREPGDG